MQDPNRQSKPVREDVSDTSPTETCQSIDWYSEGESRIVEIDGVRVVVRFVGRHGRRGRIAITAPPGATFCSANV